MARVDRGRQARPRRLLQWLAGAVAGCPGLEEVSTGSDGGRSDDPATERRATEAPEGGAREQRDLVSTRDRIGLGCALFPGCGLWLVALTSFAIGSVVALGH